MNLTKNTDHVFSAVVVAVLLILTAWGNATAMLILSAIGLVVGILWCRGRRGSVGLLALVVGFALTAAIAIVIWQSRSP
jgi:hypothetical protein